MHSVKYCVLFCVYFVADCNTLWSFDGLVSVDLADMLLYRKLLQFGVLEGLVRRVQKYPVQLVTSEASFSRVSQQQLPQKQLSKYLDGSQCFDEISCHTGQFVAVYVLLDVLQIFAPLSAAAVGSLLVARQ